MGKLLSITVAALALCASVQSCSTSSCTENQSSIPLAAFYDSATGGRISLTGVEIGGTGAPGDSLLFKADQTVTNLYLPLRSSQESTSFFIRYMGEGAPAADELTLRYTSEPFFVSEECGAMYFYRISSIETTHNVIDSVVVIDPLVNNVDIMRIKIYVTVPKAGEEEEE